MRKFNINLRKVKINKSRIPTLLGIAILVIGIATGTYLVQNRQLFRLKASPEINPKNIRITNISDSSFTVSWTTDTQTAGFVKWGNKSTSTDKATTSDKDTVSFIHSATINGLSPDTNYFFKINSRAEDFDNNGIPWQTKTGPNLPPPAEPSLISGTITTSTGQPAENVLVYVSIGGSSMLSTATIQDGTWAIPISTARTQDLASYINLDETSTLAEISIQAGPLGVASAQIYPISAKPTPPIVIGQVHDFKNLPPSSEGETPQASIGLPEESTQSSGFSVPEQISTPSAETVTLESVDEGEVVTSTEPEFFGEGPPGVTITITLESDPVSEEITVDDSGEWSWNPPEGLSGGIHKITLSWRDATGILKTLTRSFIVQAADEPAFESTPSATPTPTSTPTPTPTASPSPTATPTPTPTPTASPSPIPTSTPTSTGAAVPEAGIAIPTIVLLILGSGLLVFGGVLARFSFNQKQS